MKQDSKACENKPKLCTPAKRNETGFFVRKYFLLNQIKQSTCSAGEYCMSEVHPAVTLFCTSSVFNLNGETTAIFTLAHSS